MRVLCVGRHAFLSEHFCRFFRELGAECEGVVGTAEVARVAAGFEPHLVVGDCDLLSTSLLDAWSRERTLANVPVLAVSMTRRPEEAFPDIVCGVVGVVYLPTLDRIQALALLDGAYRPRGVSMPDHCSLVASPRPAVAH
ncbi:MAG: hypothetical protein JWN53_2175 [Gemmatimonadetes bacterium]|jgi:hypothetical protein|nr:hypothetical protein [Gemmatimonadota bacterium]